MKVVDDFLYDSLYNNIKDRLDSLSYQLVDEYEGSGKFEASLDAETRNGIKKIATPKSEILLGILMLLLLGVSRGISTTFTLITQTSLLVLWFIALTRGTVRCFSRTKRAIPQPSVKLSGSQIAWFHG